MAPERAYLLKAHARGLHRHLPLRSCPACETWHFGPGRIAAADAAVAADIAATEEELRGG